MDPMINMTYLLHQFKTFTNYFFVERTTIRLSIEYIKKFLNWLRISCTV